MKDLKFRAWDKENERWFEPTYEAYKGRLEDLSITLNGKTLIRTMEQSAIHAPERFEVMQYTGLKAWNDQEEEYKDELYDQDILYFTVFDLFDNDTQHTGIIDWSDIDACWILKVIGSKREEEYELGWVLQQDDEARKIGNTYEDKDLLNA